MYVNVHALCTSLHNKLLWYTHQYVEDWRQEMLKAVERIIEHEHGMLISMATAKEEGEKATDFSLHQTVQDQVSNWSMQLCNMHITILQSMLQSYCICTLYNL